MSWLDIRHSSTPCVTSTMLYAWSLCLLRYPPTEEFRNLSLKIVHVYRRNGNYMSYILGRWPSLSSQSRAFTSKQKWWNRRLHGSCLINLRKLCVYPNKDNDVSLILPKDPFRRGRTGYVDIPRVLPNFTGLRFLQAVYRLWLVIPSAIGWG